MYVSLCERTAKLRLTATTLGIENVKDVDRLNYTSLETVVQVPEARSNKAAKPKALVP